MLELAVGLVYEAEVTRLCNIVDDLLATETPDLALRTWMTRWSEFILAKRGMGATLQGLAASGAISKSDTGSRLTAAIQRILDAPPGPTRLRRDISAEDITTVLTGILLATGSAQQISQTHRLLELLMDGLVIV